MGDPLIKRAECSAKTNKKGRQGAAKGGQGRKRPSLNVTIRGSEGWGNRRHKKTGSMSGLGVRVLQYAQLKIASSLPRFHRFLRKTQQLGNLISTENNVRNSILVKPISEVYTLTLAHVIHVLSEQDSVIHFKLQAQQALSKKPSG
jgi:hypothetical protein